MERVGSILMSDRNYREDYKWTVLDSMQKIGVRMERREWVNRNEMNAAGSGWRSLRCPVQPLSTLRPPHPIR